MPRKGYKIDLWSPTNIKEIEIVRETEKTVWTKVPATKWTAESTRQQRKDSREPIFATRIEAIQYMLDLQRRRLNVLQQQKIKVETTIATLEQMKQEHTDATQR